MNSEKRRKKGKKSYIAGNKSAVHALKCLFLLFGLNNRKTIISSPIFISDIHSVLYSDKRLLSLFLIGTHFDFYNCVGLFVLLNIAWFHLFNPG